MSDVNIGVTGITKHGQTYYVIYNQNNCIDLFEAETPYKFQSRICIHNAHPCDLTDIASTEKYNCLYVSDRGKPCIWCISLSNHSVSKLDVEGIPAALSATADGRLIVTNQFHNCLDVFDVAVCDVKSGDCSYRRIKTNFKQEEEYVPHAVETYKGTFIVCNGFVDYNAHQVCEMNQYKITRSFGSRNSGSGERELNQPWYLVLCEKENIVFVADSQNKRVKMLDCDLNLISTIQTDDHIPIRMCYDKETRNLIIGSYNKGIRICKVDKISKEN